MGDTMAGIKIKKKLEENKEEKENKLLDSALALFTKKGVKNTSIQEIVDKAGVAKGTFYLYFKDKYDIQDYLITRKSKQLFSEAINALEKNYIKDYKDKIIFIINYIIDQFIKNKHLLKFISKNLSLGIYNDKITYLLDNNEIGIKELFIKEIKENNVNLKNPEATLFMIIELSSSTVFTSITTGKPLSIEEYKPYLYEEIRRMLEE